jgi:putative cell wall-binding protein
MSDFVNDDDGLVIEHESNLIEPTVKRSRRIDLSNLRAIKREMCKVYDDARNGRIDTQEGTRLTYQLQAIAKVQEALEISQRLDRLEDLTANK